jgi:hypothetical protein
MERWQQQCGACPDMTVIERLRRMGCTAGDGMALDRSLSSPWFEACSSRLDAMHQIEAFWPRSCRPNVCASWSRPVRR